MGQIAMIIGLIGMLGFMAHSWKVQIETNFAVRLEAGLEKQASEFRDASAKKTTAIADTMKERDLAALENKYKTDARIRELTGNIERMAHEQPFKASNLYEYNVNRIMCLISKGGNKADRETCNRFEAATENYSPKLASFTAITRETTDDWNDQCDNGVTEFCDYSLMAFTNKGSTDFLHDLEEIDYYQLRLNHAEDARIEALKYLRDLKGTE